MKNVDLSMYAKDLDLPVENYIFEEVLKPEEDITTAIEVLIND